jgi:predicted CXXCH cytochrome family protein
LNQPEKFGDYRMLATNRDSVLGKAPVSSERAMKYMSSVLIGSLLLLLAAAMQASAIEHPTTLPKDADCSSCHGDKNSGKSVHSAMAISCTVCHLVKTQDDLTTVNLAMPKEQICFACHEKSTELQLHSPVVRRQCLDCHDAHSSGRRLLLREQADAHHRQLRALSIPRGKREPEGGRATVTSRQFSITTGRVGVSP